MGCLEGCLLLFTFTPYFQSTLLLLSFAPSAWHNLAGLPQTEQPELSCWASSLGTQACRAEPLCWYPQEHALPACWGLEDEPVSLLSPALRTEM